MLFSDLNEENHLIYAIKHYNKPSCIMSEFEEDYKRIKYIKRLIRKFKCKDILKERLLLNHIIIMYNVFGPEAATRLLFLKIDEKDWDVLKTFLQFLSFMPEVIFGIKEKNILDKDVPINIGVSEVLKGI